VVTWYGQNNLELSALKTVEMVVDFRKNPAPPVPITPCDSPVGTVESFGSLGTTITQGLKWELTISSITKKAPQTPTSQHTSQNAWPTSADGRPPTT